MNCGITGHTGALGQEFIARNKHLNFTLKRFLFSKFHHHGYSKYLGHVSERLENETS